MLKRLRPVLFVVVLIAPLALDGCARKQPNLTPVGRTAYTADQIVLRVNNLQSAAIAANKNAALSDETTRLIVQFVVSADTTLKATPFGWRQTLEMAWAETKKQLGAVANVAVAAAMGAVDVALAAAP